MTEGKRRDQRTKPMRSGLRGKLRE